MSTKTTGRTTSPSRRVAARTTGSPPSPSTGTSAGRADQHILHGAPATDALGPHAGPGASFWILEQATFAGVAGADFTLALGSKVSISVAISKTFKSQLSS